MKYFSPAKINLSLDVIKKRNDGYHELKMIMQTVSLYNELDIIKDNEINIKNAKKYSSSENFTITYKAANLFFEYTGIKGGCKILINKNIPDGAGLGGSSSDAATVLIALNEIYHTNLTKTELINIASKIGADVPFFIVKGTCLAEGIGEKLTKIENKTNPFVLIYKPDFSISTKWAYENLNLDNKPSYNIEKIVKSLKNESYNFNDIFNYLEKISTKSYPEINNIKFKMKKLGATASLMSGSGSSVFGIYNDKIVANNALLSFEKGRAFLVNFI